MTLNKTLLENLAIDEDVIQFLEHEKQMENAISQIMIFRYVSNSPIKSYDLGSFSSTFSRGVYVFIDHLEMVLLFSPKSLMQFICYYRYL